jgi:acetylornithine deacetylase/succinyl-diaminopimelate desuccinylase-like protein
MDSARAERELFEELRIPSVSALPEHADDVGRNAAWLASLLAGMGFHTELVRNSGGPHPVVLAERLDAGADRPTLTVYGHYDVQPPDPLDEWESPPFEPTTRAGSVFARGAADSKGQHLTWIQAARAAIEEGGLPVNLRFLIEGEEESGGETLSHLLRERAHQLATDYVVISDAVFAPNGLPVIVTALRGLLYVEIEARGPAVDLHSGLFGGVAPNPFNTLVHVLAALKDRDGHITIPGFYDGVAPPSAAELASWRRLGDDSELVRAAMGARALEGEPEFPPLERRWSRPTLDISGIRGGFVGDGSKTVIPSQALSKLSMRLVPGQDPDDILKKLGAYVATLSSPGVELEVRGIGRARPVQLGTDHAGVKAMSRAFQEGFGSEPVLAREGFTIPVTIDFAEALGAPILVTGFVPWDAAAHSPNEHLPLDFYRRGIATARAFMQRLS